MDTLSRDSNNSGSILPLVGVIAGGLALVLSIVALVKLNTLQAKVNAQADEIGKIATLEGEIRSVAAKSESDNKATRADFQNVLNTQVGTAIGEINAKIAKIEEAMKKPAPAAAGGKGGGAVGGTVDANGNYTVAPKDSLSGIARKFGVKLDAIEAENPGLDPAKLHPGQKIKIPKK